MWIRINHYLINLDRVNCVEMTGENGLRFSVDAGDIEIAFGNSGKARETFDRIRKALKPPYEEV